jgi:hypothetical protein
MTYADGSYDKYPDFVKGVNSLTVSLLVCTKSGSDPNIQYDPKAAPKEKST